MQIINWQPGTVDILPSQPRNTEPIQTVYENLQNKFVMRKP